MTEPTDADALRADAARHRAELADTVEELAAKTNVKARVRKGAAAVAGQAVEEVKDAGRAVTDQFSGPPSAVVRRPVPWALVAVVVAGAVVGWWAWRRRS
jgi:hypothetical protein